MPAHYSRIKGWKPDREQLAWSAGFADGEGSFFWAQYKIRHPRVRFELGQVNPEPLWRFRDATGFGAPVNGPYGNTKADAKKPAQPQWTWAISGFEDVQALLAMLWPWLGTPKRKQATKILMEARESYVNDGPI